MIENLWIDLKRAVHVRQPKNLTEPEEGNSCLAIQKSEVLTRGAQSFSMTVTEKYVKYCTGFGNACLLIYLYLRIYLYIYIYSEIYIYI